MPRAICRCGESLNIPNDGSGKIVCPQCGARVKLRNSTIGKSSTVSGNADGFIRFFCPCGRRLKVSADEPPTHGKCPDCGRVVPVPAMTHAVGDSASPTEELNSLDREMLDRWSREQLSRQGSSPDSGAINTPLVNEPVTPAAAFTRAEVGLRVCPQCGKPVHLGADACRHCGTVVPRR